MQGRDWVVISWRTSEAMGYTLFILCWHGDWVGTIFNPRHTCTAAYSSWVCLCVCVCVSSSIFSNSNESAKKTYRLPQPCNCLIYNVGVFVKQPLYEDTQFVWQPYWHTCRPFCLPPQAPECISIHVTLLSVVWCFCCVLCHCVLRDTI